MKRKLIFHGYLKDLVPEGVELSGTTVAEIINGVVKQVKGLRASPKTGKHVIQVVGFNSVESLVKPIPDDVTELHIVPAMQGGKSGFFKVVIGAVLITAAVLATPGGVGAFFTGLSEGTLGFWATTAAVMGSTLVLGGLLEIVSPTPKADLGDSVDNSKYLGAQGNTVKIGTRIPLFYGEHMFFGHFLSFNVSTAQTNPNPISDHISWTPYETSDGLF